ncbi:hypothetical protein ACLKA6_010228 [Drosophila palustris]
MKLTTRLGFDQKGSSFLTGFTTHPPPCFSRNARMSTTDPTTTATRLWTDDSIPGPADARSITNWISVQTLLPIPVNFMLAEYCLSTATRLWTDDSIPGPAEGQFLLIRVALVTLSIMATTVDLWLHLADQQLQRNSWLKGTTVF